MAAYVILDITVTDPAKYEDYKKLAPAAIEAYGGKYLVRGGPMEMLEGNWQPERVVVLEFASMEMAKSWINSPEYSAARALRHESATSHTVVVQGV